MDSKRRCFEPLIWKEIYTSRYDAINGQVRIERVRVIGLAI
jgi:hypothetical protein